MIVYSFVFFLLLFVGIGISSTFFSKKSNSDYLLAGHDVKPWLAGLSAVATNNSGYMFIGMIGYTYTSGLQSMWVLFAWLLGDLAISFLVHKRLRKVTEERELLSFGGVLARWNGTDFRRLRMLVGVITIIFLGVYAAAQLKAGSKALHVLLGWDYQAGAIIGSIIVFAYCLAGGIRASIWTDAAQSITMFIAMGLLLYVGIEQFGGATPFFNKLDNVSPTYLDFFPSDLPLNNVFGFLIFVLGWTFGGVGVVGQPHIMIRFMTIDNPEHMKKTRIYYYSWYFVFCMMTLGVGLVARLIFPEVNSFDAELALPKMGQALLPEILIGIILAGIFSATMSTADSQVLSCSAAFSRDILPKEKDTLMVTKFSTALVTILALLIALFGSANVFGLVMMSWAILAAAFAPLLLIYALEKKVTETVAILMVVNGSLITLGWMELGFGSFFYSGGPGILAGLITYYVADLTKWNQPSELQLESKIN